MGKENQEGKCRWWEEEHSRLGLGLEKGREGGFCMEGVGKHGKVIKVAKVANSDGQGCHHKAEEVS